MNVCTNSVDLHCVGCGCITSIPPTCGPCFALLADLDRRIALVCASTAPDLGLTLAQAAEMREQIAANERTDDDALTAYDLLHNRVISGRAF